MDVLNHDLCLDLVSIARASPSLLLPPCRTDLVDADADRLVQLVTSFHISQQLGGRKGKLSNLGSIDTMAKQRARALE